MKSVAVVLFASWLAMAAGIVQAGRSNVQFSAETVQSSPDNRLRHALIFVGDNQVRLEYQKDNQVAVNIYDMKNGRAVFLVPDQKTYMMRQVSQGQLSNPMLPPGDLNPCSYIPDARCRQLATETLYGRQVVKWEIEMSGKDGKPAYSQLWIDAERLMPLRQIWSDGSTFEMHLLGLEERNGRSTERWESVKTGPDGKSMKSLQWYDPELNLAIREELPGGYFRELRNVRVGPQSEELFTVPPDYRRITPQAGTEGLPPQSDGRAAGRVPGNAR